MAKMCDECGAPRGTPHKEECSSAAYRGAREEIRRCVQCLKNVTHQRHGVVSCNRCGKSYYACCDEHTPAAQQMVNGHVFRVHPDVLPDADIDRVLDDAGVLAELHKQFEADPRMWVQLKTRLEARAAARAAAHDAEAADAVRELNEAFAASAGSGLVGVGVSEKGVMGDFGTDDEDFSPGGDR